jgi:CRP-like cAMP-binding protein
MNDLPLFKQYAETVFKYCNRYIELSAEKFAAIASYFEIRNFDRRAIITQLGQVETHYNIVMRGLLRKYLPVKKNEIIIQLATEGQIIQADISINHQVPSDCIIEAIEPVSLLSISFENVQQVYQKYPETERLGRLLFTELFIKKDFHGYMQLNKSTRERFLDYMEAHPDMIQRIPQKHLASYLNIKPETFSRLKHLVKEKK